MTKMLGQLEAQAQAQCPAQAQAQAQAQAPAQVQAQAQAQAPAQAQARSVYRRNQSNINGCMKMIEHQVKNVWLSNNVKSICGLHMKPKEY